MRSNNVSLKILACILIFCATCGLSCRRKTPPADVDKPAQAPEETRLETAVDLAKPAPVTETGQDSVAVTVNGVEITDDEIDKIIEPILAKMAKQGQAPSPERMEQMKKMFRQQATERMIIDQLIDEKAKQANVVITEEELDSRIQEIASMQKPPMSVEDFKKNLEDRGENFDQVKQQIEKGFLFRKLMQAQAADSINITIEDANQFYQENHGRYEMPEQIKASHILITPDTTDPNADPNEAKAKAKAKAEELLEQIKAGGDFAELAKANSDCPSSRNGGDLGLFSRGRMVPAFETVAFELEIGQISDVVETRFGYHIIKVADHKDAETKTFEQVKGEIMQQLSQRKQRELARQYLESLKAEADIVYPPGKEPEARMPRPMPRPTKPVEPNTGG